jgi:alpha-tubulin suppressor-like RCC1 family protein
MIVVLAGLAALAGCGSGTAAPNGTAGAGGRSLSGGRSAGGTPAATGGVPVAAGGTGGDAGALPVCGTVAGDHVVVAVSPVDQESPVLRVPNITVTLSEEIACPLPASAKLSLLKDGQAVPLDVVSCGGFPSILVLRPTVQLDYVTRYTLRIEGLDNGMGNAIAPCQVRFTTKSKTVGISGTSLALDQDGTLWYWGSNPLNLASTGVRGIPEKVPLSGRVVTMAAGSDYGLAALADGTVWGWGDNESGQLGRGTVDGPERPLDKVQLTLPAGVTVVSLAAAGHHALAARSDGIVMAWGLNAASELGLGYKSDPVPTPTAIPNLTNVAVVAGADGMGCGGFSLAVTKSGAVYGWGCNSEGTLDLPVGPAFPASYASPTQVNGVSGITAIATGTWGTYAIGPGGNVYSWGCNINGALGNGDCGLSGDILLAALVGAAGNPLAQAVSVAAASTSGLVVLSDGTVWGWGSNYSGILGNGTLGSTVICSDGNGFDNTQLLPAKALNIHDAVAVSASTASGTDDALVLRSDGTVWAAGYNPNNDLGLSAADFAVYVTVFKQVPGL